MADFSGVTPDSPGVQSSPVLKPSTGRLPVAFGEHIKTGSTTRGGDDDLDSVMAEAKTDLGTKGDASDVERLQAAAGDIVLGEKVVPSWGDVNASGAEGGVSWDNAPTLAKAQAKDVSDWHAPSATIPSPGSFPMFRVPRGSDPRHYSVVYPNVASGGLNLAHLLGHDSNWDYYEERVRYDGVVTLQHNVHTVGENTWGGKLGAIALAQVAAEAETHVDALETEVDALETRVDVVTTRVGTLETGGLGLRRVILSNNTGVNFEGVTFPYSGRLDHASARDLVYAELSDGTSTWVMKYKGVSPGGNIDFEDTGENGREIHFQANNAGVRLFVKDDNADTTLSALLVFADGLWAPRLIPLSGQIDNHHLIWTDSATTSTWNNPGRILTANAADAIYQGLLVAPYWKRLELEIEYSAGSPALYEHALATIATVRGGGGGKVNNPVRLHGIAFMGALLDIQINLVRGGQIRADNSHLKISGVSWASGSETFNVKLYGVR